MNDVAQAANRTRPWTGAAACQYRPKSRNGFHAELKCRRRGYEQRNVDVRTYVDFTRVSAALDKQGRV